MTRSRSATRAASARSGGTVAGAFPAIQVATSRAWLAALGTVLLTAPAAPAWEAHRAIDGQYLRWAGPSALVKVRLVPPPAAVHLRAPEGVRVAVVAAASAWQAVETAHVPVRFGGSAGASAVPALGEVVVGFDLAGNFPGGRDAAGFTELVQSGHGITAARVHLNGRDFDWATDGGPTALDVQTIVEHELGHALGLAHPCGDPDTQTTSCTALSPSVRTALEADVMYASTTPGPRRTLSPDDHDGITALLPAAAAEPAPLLARVQPACLAGASLSAALAAQPLSLLQSSIAVTDEASRFELDLEDDGAPVAATVVSRAESGTLIAQLPATVAAAGVLPRSLTAVLVDIRSSKGATGLDALEVSTRCTATHGCSSGGAPALFFLPLAAFLLRRRRTALAPRARTVRAAALVAGLLVSLPAHAYKRSVNGGGLCVFWATRGHSFIIDAKGTPDVVGTAAFTAVRKSFAAWAGAAGSDLSFPDQGLSVDPKNRKVGFFPGQFNVNLILWRTASCTTTVPPGDACLTDGGCGNKYDCWDHGDAVIATTTTTSNRYTGQISDTDIELNDAPGSDGSTKFSFTANDGPPCNDPNQTGCVRIDIENTITHEAGHSLGLDHTTVPDATMFATAPEGEISKRTLHDDDIQAIQLIYPAGKPTLTCLSDPITLTQTGSSSSAGCSTASSVGALPLLLLLGLLRRRKR